MISRRTMLTATLAGIPLGVVGGLFARSLQGAGASIRFLGRDNAMIALLDTGGTRALFLLGDPDVMALANVAQLLTIGRTRIDLIIGSHHWLTTEGLRSVLDLHRITTLSLQAHASLPPIRGKVIPVTDQQLLELGDECDVMIWLGDTISGQASDPVVHIGVRCRGTRIVLAGRAAALGDEGALALLAVPGNVDADTLERINPALFVGTELPGAYDGPVLLAHHNDPVKLEIKENTVAN